MLATVWLSLLSAIAQMLEHKPTNGRFPVIPIDSLLDEPFEFAFVLDPSGVRCAVA